MARVPRYDVQAEWDDPFERHEERRSSERAEVRIRVSIAAKVEGHTALLKGPGIVRNISPTGMCLVTKHVLEPGQQVTLQIPTESCPSELCLPEAFEGTAEVVRVLPDEKNRMVAAFRFGDDLAGNMEFAMFVERIQELARVR